MISQYKFQHYECNKFVPFDFMRLNLKSFFDGDAYWRNFDAKYGFLEEKDIYSYNINENTCLE